MKNIDFSMTYLALKMFGKQLYANMSAAIAELVANGLDANAENIYVYMDIRDKNSATIAIFDDGDGMDETAMEKNYAVVGRNKRENLEPEEASKKMGRKGIGKLAALYLSNTYYVITKKMEQKEARAWKLDVSNFQADNSTPQLVEVEYPFVDPIIFAEKLKKSGKGTIILLNNVLIKNFGEAAEDALEYKLANYFLTDELSKKIRLCVLRKNDDPVVFSEVKKNIAYKNMAVIFTTDAEKFSDIAQDDVYYHDKNLKTKSQIYNEKREILVLPDTIETTIKDEKGKSEKVRKNSSGEIEIDGKKYTYELKGWIGIHATIESEDAKLNCDNYRKNMHYNPNQLRVYVRNKLATSHFLNYLGMTATFLNYIEGEISFDILDVEGLEDIATAGRDNFSVQDERVKLLIALAKGIVGRLVSKRQKIADNMGENRIRVELELEEKSKREIKSRFQRGAIKSKSILEKLPKEEQEAIEDDYVQFSRAVNLSNATKMIFISHKTDCKEFGELLIDVFLEVYPPIKSSIIFSSDSDFGVPQGQDILEYLKTCFREDMHVIFLFSKSFYDSNVCLAEAGAAWGTNKQYTNFVIDIGFGDISEPINRNQKGAVLVNLQEQDYKDFAKEVIRILKSVGVEQEFEVDSVLEIVKRQVNKHMEQLLVPEYIPRRKFQIVPKCSNCNHKMVVQCIEGNLKYTCECGNELNADIV